MFSYVEIARIEPQINHDTRKKKKEHSLSWHFGGISRKKYVVSMETVFLFLKNKLEEGFGLPFWLYVFPDYSNNICVVQWHGVQRTEFAEEFRDMVD